MTKRAYHRPISIRVEKIERMPDTRTLPDETQLTINLKFNRDQAREMVLFLLNSLWVDDPVDLVIATITGPSP